MWHCNKAEKYCTYQENAEKYSLQAICPHGTSNILYEYIWYSDTQVYTK